MRFGETDAVFHNRTKGPSVLQIAVLAFSLSADAFAAAVAKGARFPSMSLPRTAGIALGFGLLEASAPLLGYLLGKQFAGVIEDFDHWVAFAILAVWGCRMIWKSFNEGQKDDEPSVRPSLALVFATALGTSVDATAVGVTLALFTDNIPMALAVIGIVTLGMTFVGLRLGGAIGERIGHWAERLGGIGLITIGTSILITHMSA